MDIRLSNALLAARPQSIAAFRPSPANPAAADPSSGRIIPGGAATESSPTDRVTDSVAISAEARARAAREQTPESETESTAALGRPVNGAEAEFSEEERAQIDELEQRDAEVRRHEQAHKAAGGPYAGAISYEYEEGPDGKRYAVGGSVPIDVSPVPGDPEATIAKMKVVRKAALAPAEPSGADRRIAATAQRQLVQAQAELAETRRAEARGESADESLAPANPVSYSAGPSRFESPMRGRSVDVYA